MLTSEAWGISTRGFESPNQDVTTLSEAWGIRTPDNLIKSLRQIRFPIYHGFSMV